MLYINAAHVDDFAVEDCFTMPAVTALRLWPPNSAPLSWPATPILSNRQMYELAYSMDQVSAQPQVKWGGQLPTF